jgi:hypothetical protein
MRAGFTGTLNEFADCLAKALKFSENMPGCWREECPNPGKTSQNRAM